VEVNESMAELLVSLGARAGAGKLPQTPNQ
jgi:hypothetical protein